VKHLIPEFERMRERFPAGFESSLVLPCLHRIQQDRGWIAEEDVEALADWLGVPRIQVEEVLSFYTMFRRAPEGRHQVQVCRNLSCSMQGAERLLEHVQRRLGVAPGHTTPDGRCTFGTVECLGSCGTAPVMMIDGRYHEKLTIERADELLDGLE
jgi:NADH-quinone oxidoreductase subunit E